MAGCVPSLEGIKKACRLHIFINEKFVRGVITMGSSTPKGSPALLGRTTNRFRIDPSFCLA